MRHLGCVLPWSWPSGIGVLCLWMKTYSSEQQASKAPIKSTCNGSLTCVAAWHLPICWTVCSICGFVQAPTCLRTFISTNYYNFLLRLVVAQLKLLPWQGFLPQQITSKTSVFSENSWSYIQESNLSSFARQSCLEAGSCSLILSSNELS